MWEQFLVADEFAAMSTDALLSTHPLHALNIETPAQISELFDGTYLASFLSLRWHRYYVQQGRISVAYDNDLRRCRCWC